MLLICGTVPVDDLPLTAGEVSFNGEHIIVNDNKVPCTQGTAALISAACATAAEAGSHAPHALIVGDNGNGRGSRQIYEYVAGNLARLEVDHLVLHYMLPVMGLMRKICAAADKCRRRPVLVADAAAMYAAKAAGLAPQFDVFTPDLSELAFLADPEASHPAYVGKHLFGCEISSAPDLVRAAYKKGNCSRSLLVKGSTDYIVEEGEIIGQVTSPDVPGLEAIGGTGDTITGILAALLHSGMKFRDAAFTAAWANRMAGSCINATPATRIRQVVEAIPKVLGAVIK
jgi:ADP-dependent NAD(P)H-hydrate dehydratase / NAD(P)H-hydrate epimerase